jgi:hydrogenase maturation protein HypF
VQGVGFRPFVYRLASELELSGHVFNDSRGVVLEVEGDAVAMAAFLARLEAEAPPLARIEGVAAEELAPSGGDGFEILESPSEGEASAPVSPDTATCDDCLAELFDPGDRRYRYPFINCTNCGPRFTIVRGVPYDRPLTTMASTRIRRTAASTRSRTPAPSAVPVWGFRSKRWWTPYEPAGWWR